MAYAIQEGSREAEASELLNIENIAHALMRNGMSESAAIATAVNATRRWAKGKGKVHPEVIAASRAALAEWERLKESHHQ